MSYILDALRRADAERDRERNAVPDLHTPTRRLDPTDDDAPRRGLPPWAWLGFGAVLTAVGIGVWTLRGNDAPPPVAAVAPQPVTRAPEPQQAPPVAVAPSPSPAPARPATPSPKVNPVPGPGAARPSSPPPKPVPPANAAPTPVPAMPRTPAPAPTVAQAPAPRPPAPAPENKPTATPSAGAPDKAPELPILKMAELPESMRRELPPMTVSGSMHSPDPAGRMLILNGQVLREGNTVSAGLVLEQIRPKSAIFSIKGQRFEVPF
jgi:general secretion pathway protein B